jgi:potassium-dependent mechanosensitive channel
MDTGRGARVPRPSGGCCTALLLLLSLPLQAEVAQDALEAELASRREAITSDPAFDAATRHAALARLQEAQGLLETAARDRLEITRLAGERSAAPTALAALAGDPAPAAPAPDGVPGPDLTLEQLEMAGFEADDLARAARTAMAEADRQLADLRSRQPTIGTEIAAAREAAAESAREVARLAAAAQQVQGTGSEELLARARQVAAEARLALLEEQRNGADLREQWLAAQVSLAAAESGRRDARAQAIRDELARRRSSEAANQSRAWQATAVGEDPRVAALVESSRELARNEGGDGSVAQRIESARTELATLERQIANFEGDGQEVRARLDGLGRTYAAGMLVRQAIEQLPSIEMHAANVERRRLAINDIQLQSVALANELRRIERDGPGEALRLVSRQAAIPAAERAAAVAKVEELLEARKRLLAPLLKDMDQLQSALVELQVREQALLGAIRDADRQLRSREPWVRNGRRVTRADLPAAAAALAALAAPSRWSGGAAALREHARQRPWPALGTLAGIAVTAAVGYALHRRRRQIARDPTAVPRMRTPVAVLAAALANGAAWCALVMLAGGWLAAAAQAPHLLHALGSGLVQVSPGAFLSGFIRSLFARHGGAAAANPALAAAGHRFRLLAWQLLVVLALLVTSRMLWSAGLAGVIEHGELGARLALLAMSLFAGACVHRMMLQRLRERTATMSGASGWRLGRVHAVAASIPLLFFLLLLQGFTVGAFDLARALIGTMLVLIIAGTLRMLFLEPATEGASARADWSSLREGRLDLLHVLVVLGSLAGLALIWRDVFRDLLYLQNVVLWTTETVEGLKTITVANLLSSIAALAATLIVFWALPLAFALERKDSGHRGAGTRYAAVTLVRYVVLLAGLVAAFSALNIGWSKLQWMAAGLSVGLGFGLQETAANFFSGLTLLSERSIRVGDTVTVGDKTGIVRRIKVRATTLEDFDGREVVIPNKELVTTQVTNWTLNDTRRRLQLAVGVAYGSDTALVVSKLLEAAAGIPEVLPDPAPQAVFEQFGDSVLQFRLYVWIAGPQHAMPVNHELHMRIDALFRASGIAIDFPQRDIHLHPAGPFDVRLRTEPVSGPA